MNVRKRVLSLLLSVILVMQMIGIESFASNSSAVIDSGECGAEGNNLTWELSYDGVLTISGTGEIADYGINEETGKSTAPWGEYAQYIPELVIEEGVTSIGSWAFYYFWNLQKASIAGSVTKISEYAFATVGQEMGCMIRFYGNAPEIVQTYEGGCAFDGSHLQFFYDADASGWSEIASKDEFEAMEIKWHAVGDDGILASGSCDDHLTWTLNEDGMLNISGSGAMKDEPGWLEYFVLISQVSLPEGLTSLGDYAFNSCRHLKEVVIPESVTEIGKDAFSYCAGLEKIKFHGNAPDIAEDSFYDVEATAYYPAGNTTWTSEVMQDYGGDLTWEENVMDEQPPVISDVWPAADDAVTLCHDAEFQIKAVDNLGLSHAEVWCRVGEAEPVKLGTKEENTDGLFVLNCSLEQLSGEAELIYRVYDEADNYAETKANVTIRTYHAPVIPNNLTAEAGFRSTALSWSYDGDRDTLKQFQVYSCNESGGTIQLLANVKNYSYTVKELSETVYFKVCAQDIYGNESDPALICVTPVTTETQAPTAVIQNSELTGVTGQALTFSGAGSADNDAIVSYTWDFGDGTTGTGVNAEHTYTQGGNYTVTLTVTDRSGNIGTATAAVTVYDTLGEDATHALLTISVKDGYKEGTPAVGEATVTVYNDSGFEIAAKTNNSGVAKLIVPKGDHTMSVVKSGYGTKVKKITVPNEDNIHTFYLAESGVSVIGGKLTADSMTYEEIVEAGIDVSNPANNHVVKQEFSIRFQPTPELQFDLNLEQMINATGEMLKGTGFGWHTFTPDSETPDEDENPGGTVTNTPEEWTAPKYDVGVFPVGDSAFMVIYGQSHWLKEMFHVELIVFNTSYAEDITECYAELPLPEGLSFANLLEGEQHEKVKVGNGTIEYIGKQENGVDVGSNIRQVNWYVRGDGEGDYHLTAKVNGKVGETPFETTFTAEQPIHVYAGNALKLTVTLPKSAYHGKDYMVNFGLTNVSDRSIYNLSFGLQSVYQFVAEYMSDGTQGETEKILDNEDFENKKTYGLPELKPGQTFNVSFKTTFLYEHQFVEWAVGRVSGLETGYKAADTFVTTLNGSTTEIPVEFVYEDVKKDSFFEWIYDESIGAIKENIKEFIVEFIDDKICQGIPVAKNVVKVFEVGSEIKENDDGTEVTYYTAVTLTEGCKFVTEEEAMASVYGRANYGLRRSAVPGVLVWTDAEDYEISENGMTMKLNESGKLYVMRVGAASAETEIGVTTHYMDVNGEVKEFTRKLIAKELDNDGNLTGGEYRAGLQAAESVLMDDLTESTFMVPDEGEMITVLIPAYRITENGDILLKASNEIWTITDSEGKLTEGMQIADGVLSISSEAKAGTYTVKLVLQDTDSFKTQTIVLTERDSGGGQASEQKPTKNPEKNESASENSTEKEIYWAPVDSKIEQENSNPSLVYRAVSEDTADVSELESSKENDNIMDLPVSIDDVHEDAKDSDAEAEESETEISVDLVKEEHVNSWIGMILLIIAAGVCVLFVVLKRKKEKMKLK